MEYTRLGKNDNGIGAFVLVVGTAGAVAQNETVYSESMPFNSSFGFASVLVSSTAGSITVTQQCSPDGTNWYNPVDADGTALGRVVSAMTVGSKYVQPDPVLAPWIRYKVVEGNTASTVVTLTVLSQDEI